MIRERTQAGLAAARARGRMGGRPKKLGTGGKIAMAQALYDDKTHSIANICKTLGISRTMLYRYIRAYTPLADWDRRATRFSTPRHLY